MPSYSCNAWLLHFPCFDQKKSARSTRGRRLLYFNYIHSWMQHKRVELPRDSSFCLGVDCTLYGISWRLCIQVLEYTLHERRKCRGGTQRLHFLLFLRSKHDVTCQLAVCLHRKIGRCCLTFVVKWFVRLLVRWKKCRICCGTTPSSRLVRRVFLTRFRSFHVSGCCFDN